MKTLWILVADAAEARIYSSQPPERAVLVESFAHPEAHLQERDIVTDRPGRAASDFGGGVSFTPAVKAVDTELDRFAALLADALEKGLEAHSFTELALVMPPRLLGRVRSHLTKPTAAVVVASLDKRLNETPIDDIVERIAGARVESHA